MILDGNSTRGVMMLRSLNVEKPKNICQNWRQPSKDAACLGYDFVHVFVEILYIASCRNDHTPSIHPKNQEFLTIGSFDATCFGSATALQTTL